MSKISPSRLSKVRSEGSNAGTERELRLAKLRIAKLELENEKLRKLHEFDIKEQQLNDEIESVCTGIDSVNKKERVQEYVDSLPAGSERMNFEANEVAHVEQSHVESSGIRYSELAQLLNACMGLPQRKLKKFDGDPGSYYSFIRGFMTTVARYTMDPANRLSYLLSYCEGEAYKAIERCTILEPHEGYEEALRILERRFGEPHVIARKYIEELTDGPVLKADDHKGLMCLVESMKACSVTLKSLHFESDLHACRTLGSIVRRLPGNIQSRWFDVASAILKRKREPNFDDLTHFLSERADAAAVRCMYLPPQRESDVSGLNRTNPSRKSPRHYASTLMTQNAERNNDEKIRCLKCGSIHYLDQCPKFSQLKVQERRDFAQQHSLCYLCLKPNHMSKVCRSRHTCSYNGCSGKHHFLLHDDTLPRTGGKTPVGNGTPVGSSNVNHSRIECSDRLVSLAVVPVKLCGPKGVKVVNALLDSGSDSTLVRRDALLEIGIEGQPTRLSLCTVNDEKMLEARLVSFEIEAVNSTERLTVRQALAVENLPKLKASASQHQLHRWKHLHDVPLTETCEDDIGLLLGCDVPKAHWVFDQRRGGPDEPYAVKGPLGWVILGPLKKPMNCSAMTNYLSQNDDINALLQQMFNFEFQETSVKREMSVEDRAALKCMEDSTKFVDGHYQIGLPWKDGAPHFPDNSALAYKRLFTLKNRFCKDKTFWEMYTMKMEEYLERGYAEIVPQKEQRETGTNVWYLPHHGVFKPGDPTKVRIVFDCAAKFNETSLNLQLRSGPDLTNNLCGVLLRFREYPLVLIADIEAMFHQVRVEPKNRDSLRFLWWPNGDISRKPMSYRMTVHPFGATSSPSCASLALHRALEDHLSVFGEDVVNQSKRFFYVDDCLVSMSDASVLRTTAHRLRAALLSGGFNLTKFYSNVKGIVEDLPHSDRTVSFMLDRQPVEIRRTLGVQWNDEDDCFQFTVEPWKGKLTRRSLLSYVASLYDPLGLVAPVLLPAKLLIQDLCRRSADWDEQLMDDETARLNGWLDYLAGLESIRIPRCLTSHLCLPFQRVELHGFSDACGTGYGASVYIRVIDNVGTIKCSLLLGKSRVAPMKATSIPRLELAAAVLSAKLTVFAKNELSIPVHSITLWTDSMIVLQFIHNRTTRYETYVANRLSVIHELSDTTDWMFVESKLNPADLASRGMNLNKRATQTWFEGPSFLYSGSDQWPVQPSCLRAPECILEGTGKAVIHYTERPTIWLNRFAAIGNWFVLLRRIAWLRRFSNWVISKYIPSSMMTVQTGYLTTAELKSAEVCILKMVQRFHYPATFKLLQQGSNRRERKHSELNQLSPFVKDGLLRVGGRLRWAPIPFDSKHPIIIPKNSFVTNLLVMHYHEINGHVGTLHVLSAIRERFWIVNGQSVVRRVLKTCMRCRIWHSKPGSQIMAPIPTDRMLVGRAPFSAVGIDYFGPLLVKRGRGTEKRYGCIFTCLTIRAVHLEVAHSLETDSFLCAFSRFVARRGQPTRVYSDNGTNFRGAEMELKRLLKQWNQKRISDRMLEKGCDWIFSPPNASHRGGIWERMIRSIRRIMRSMLGDQLVTDEVLLTVLTEIENIINSRPLTELSDNSDDLAALTPNHLLLLRGNNVEVSSCGGSMLIRKWKQAQHLADLFWTRWLKDYLPLLQAKVKWQSTSRNLKKGDLVLLTENAPRGQWPKAIVQEPITGEDGMVREAWVRTRNGLVRRDVRQMCLLEEAEPESE